MFKVLHRKANGFLNKLKYRGSLKNSSLEVIPPQWTTSSFLGQDTLSLVEECMTLTEDMPIDAVWSKHFAWGGDYFGAYDYWDIRMLCGLIRKFKIDNIVECSPNQGWSTLFMRLARPLKSHTSFDIENFEGTIRTKLREFQVDRGWDFILGDFKQKSLEHLDKIKNADLLFLDSDHRLDFAVWYLEKFKILDRLKPGCLVHIHDIYPKGKEPPSPDFAESPYIADFLTKNKAKFDIIFNYETCRLKRSHSKYPGKFFLNHAGVQANNPSVWFAKAKV